MKTHLAKNLIHLRKREVLTQQELADRIDISRKTIGALEEGRSLGHWQTLKKIGMYYRETIDDLLFKKMHE
jgi:DNA-binding XRE family transcriptional regulator